jgi:nitrilase
VKDQSIKVGIAQFSPVQNNLSACLSKMAEIVGEAVKEGVQLLVFGETWLSGYPAWIDHCPDVALWDDPSMKKAYRLFFEGSVDIEGDSLQLVCDMAKANQLSIVLGINEKVKQGPGNGTVFNSVIIIDEHGEIKVHHRKLMPTYSEKMLYGLGDGSGLEAADLSVGRVGALICWEHWMPLTRQAMHNSGEQIHIALWPQVHDMLQLSSRHYAFEGRCFVLAVGQIMTAAQIPSELKLPEKLAQAPETQILNGGSSIIGPNGQYLVEPVYGKEQLIVATLDLGKVIEEQMTLDTSGHYQRPDVFTFEVKNQDK